MRRVMASTVAFVIACVLGGCGGTSEKPKPSGTVQEDRAAAEKISLKLADFPSDWTTAPHQPTSDEAAAARQFAECVGIPNAASRYRADVRSPDFNKTQTVSASSQVRMARTVAEASADLAALQSDKGPECFKQTIEKLLPGRLPAGTTTANLSVRQLEFPTLKDGTAAYRAEFTIAAGGGLTVPVYVDFIVFRSGRAEVSLNALETGSPFTSSLEQDLAKKMAGRA